MKEKRVRINTIEGYENIKNQYWISNSDEDKVINKDSGKLRKIQFNKDGYKIVSLQTKDRKQKTYKIHILKASAFIYTPNPLDTNVVRHLNDCKTDNRLENLAWGTRSDNAKDSMRNGSFNYEVIVKNCIRNGTITAKKLSKPIRCIETGITYASACEAECKLGIPHTNISANCLGKRKSAGGLHWEFTNQENED